MRRLTEVFSGAILRRSGADEFREDPDCGATGRLDTNGNLPEMRVHGHKLSARPTIEQLTNPGFVMTMPPKATRATLREWRH